MVQPGAKLTEANDDLGFMTLLPLPPVLGLPWAS